MEKIIFKFSNRITLEAENDKLYPDWKLGLAVNNDTFTNINMSSNIECYPCDGDYKITTIVFPADHKRRQNGTKWGVWEASPLCRWGEKSRVSPNSNCFVLATSFKGNISWVYE